MFVFLCIHPLPSTLLPMRQFSAKLRGSTRASDALKDILMHLVLRVLGLSGIKDNLVGSGACAAWSAFLHQLVRLVFEDKLLVAPHTSNRTQYGSMICVFHAPA